MYPFYIKAFKIIECKIVSTSFMVPIDDLYQNK